jgi:hypothetical protein
MRETGEGGLQSKIICVFFAVYLFYLFSLFFLYCFLYYSVGNDWSDRTMMVLVIFGFGRTVIMGLESDGRRRVRAGIVGRKTPERNGNSWWRGRCATWLCLLYLDLGELSQANCDYVSLPVRSPWHV